MVYRTQTREVRTREMSCEEFWQVAAGVRGRLPHFQTAPFAMLAIADRIDGVDAIGHAGLDEGTGISDMSFDMDFDACWVAAAMGLSIDDLREGRREHERLMRTLGARFAADSQHPQIVDSM